MKRLKFPQTAVTLPFKIVEKLRERGFEVVSITGCGIYNVIETMVIRSEFFDLRFDQLQQKITQTVRRSITPDNLNEYLKELTAIPILIRGLKRHFTFLLMPEVRHYLEKKIMVDAGALVIKMTNAKNPIERWYNKFRKQLYSRKIPFKAPKFKAITIKNHTPNKSAEIFLNISMLNYTYHYKIIIGLDLTAPYSKSFTLERIVKKNNLKSQFPYKITT